MGAKTFTGRVLEDGHLSLPDEVAKEKGKAYEVILLSAAEDGIFEYAEALAREKGFDHLTEKDISRIVLEVRGIPS